jgi:hypothetical protein
MLKMTENQKENIDQLEGDCKENEQDVIDIVDLVNALGLQKRVTAKWCTGISSSNDLSLESIQTALDALRALSLDAPKLEWQHHPKLCGAVPFLVAALKHARTKEIEARSAIPGTSASGACLSHLAWVWGRKNETLSGIAACSAAPARLQLLVFGGWPPSGWGGTCAFLFSCVSR